MRDLISRQALREAMYEEAMVKDSDEQRWDGGCWIRYKMFERVIDSMPTIDAVPVKHGEWVVVSTEDWCTFDECKCSKCGVVEYFNKGWNKYNYCPNCGARMESEDDV